MHRMPQEDAFCVFAGAAGILQKDKIWNEIGVLQMTYQELLQLDSFGQAELLVENTDINHYVKGAQVVETLDVRERVRAGDLVFVSGACFQKADQDLSAVISRLNDRKAAGIVVSIGPYLQEIPESCIALARELKLPLLTLPYEVSVSDAIPETYFALFRSQGTRKEGDRFVRELLYGDEQRALFRLGEFNYVRTRQHIVIFLSFDRSGYDRELIEELALAVPINLSLQLFSVCYADEDGVIVVLELSQKESIKDIVKRIISSVQKALGTLLQGNTVSAGVSSVFYEPERMKACINEAKKAFQVLQGCQVRHSARYYEEIGIYRFFFEFNKDLELRDFVLESLGELIRYDEENNSDYVSTLEVYLDENCNIGETAEKMFVHRNTIKYRITRVEEILDVDLNNVNTQFNLRFAYKVRKYLGQH